MSTALGIERSNTVLYCRRWDDTAAFYRAAIGLTAVFENDWFVEFEIAPACFVSIADASRATIDAADGRGITITWKVRDLESARATLAGRQVDVSEIFRRWGATAFYCHDPEGHRIEFWSDAGVTPDGQ